MRAHKSASSERHNQLSQLKNRVQRGQATVEYLYVLPILLLLLLGSMQFAFIYEAKQTLNYAIFVGTRSGALNNGTMAAIQDGVASGLAPLFVHDTTQQALKDARLLAKTEITDSKLALIEVLNPPAEALAGLSEIPNDNLMYRPPDDLVAGMNVQDANLLKVRITYCVRLVVPIVNRMIYSFTVSPPTKAEEIDSTYSGGKISATDIIKSGTPAKTSGLCISPTDPYPFRTPVTAEAVIRMQTPFQGG